MPKAKPISLEYRRLKNELFNELRLVSMALVDQRVKIDKLTDAMIVRLEQAVSAEVGGRV